MSLNKLKLIVRKMLTYLKPCLLFLNNKSLFLSSTKWREICFLTFLSAFNFYSVCIQLCNCTRQNIDETCMFIWPSRQTYFHCTDIFMSFYVHLLITPNWITCCCHGDEESIQWHSIIVANVTKQNICDR